MTTQPWVSPCAYRAKLPKPQARATVIIHYRDAVQVCLYTAGLPSLGDPGPGVFYGLSIPLRRYSCFSAFRLFPGQGLSIMSLTGPISSVHGWLSKCIIVLSSICRAWPWALCLVSWVHLCLSAPLPSCICLNTHVCMCEDGYTCVHTCRVQGECHVTCSVARVLHWTWS